MSGKEYKNFYENMAEAQYRLVGTIVLYDGEPYSVVAITDHKPDGIFRVYLWPIKNNKQPYPPYTQEHLAGSAAQATYLDTFLETDPGKNSGMLRKHINSPSFNKFRPFLLGMINQGGHTYYLEREPQRIREQGLTRAHVTCTTVSLSSSPVAGGRWHNGLHGPEFRDCIVGAHPTVKEVIEGLRDPSTDNDAVAFHRDMALVRAPLDMMFLNVKGNTVGMLEGTKDVRLSKKFGYLKESIESSSSFDRVLVQA
jgi:hypothetical protein